MPKFETQVLVNRPVFQVFRYVGDFNNDVNWRNVHNIGITSGDPIRTGSMVAMTRRIMGRKGFVNSDVTDYDRNKKIVLKGSYWGFPFVSTIIFDHRGQQTNVRESLEIRTRWFFWFGIFFNLTLKGVLRREWEALKQLLDSHADLSSKSKRS
ncbi:MAG: SRPBCC family protein [Chloroflexi bacterium]|nr:SRPBCC family protein [Chloroflexota bacterium]